MFSFTVSRAHSLGSGGQPWSRWWVCGWRWIWGFQGRGLWRMVCNVHL